MANKVKLADFLINFMILEGSKLQTTSFRNKNLILKINLLKCKVNIPESATSIDQQKSKLKSMVTKNAERKSLMFEANDSLIDRLNNNLI